MTTAKYAPAQERITFSLSQEPDPLPNRCEEAGKFFKVCEPMVEKVQQLPDEIAINVALLQLQHQFFMRYQRMPVAHQDTCADHSCVFQVYVCLYERLWELLLTENPPPLRPAPSPPAQPQFDGILLGNRV